MATTIVKSEAIDIRSLHQVCRLCLGKESLADDMFKDSNLHQWISDLLSIKISIEDRLSKAICAMCRQRLTEFHHFRERSHEVQGVLRSMLQNENVATEPVMTGNKKIKESTGHGCARCGKSFFKRQHLDKHMKINTNHIHHSKAKVVSNKNAVLTEIREIKTEPFDECDIELGGPSSTDDPELDNRQNSDQHEHVTVVLPYNAVRSREEADHEGFFFADVDCEQSMIDIEDVKVEPIGTGEDAIVLRDKTSSKIGANIRDGVLPDKRKQDAVNVEKFQCNKCHKTVQSGRALWGHYRTVHGPKNHTCGICEIAFPFLKDLKKHEVTNKHLIKLKEIRDNRKGSANTNRSGTVGSQKEPENVSDVTENNNLTPNPNRKSSKRKRQVRGHMGNHSKEIEEQSVNRKNKGYMPIEVDDDYRPHTSTIVQPVHASLGDGNEQLQCNICHELFPNEKKLMLHKKYHGSKRLECSTCGKTFLNRFVLQEHISSHGSRKPKLKLVKPVVQGIPAGKPYKCHICQKVFKLQSSLRNHRNEKHGPRTHDCYVCSSKFATGFDLQWHMKIHFNSDSEETDERNEVKDIKSTP